MMDPKLIMDVPPQEKNVSRGSGQRIASVFTIALVRWFRLNVLLVGESITRSAFCGCASSLMSRCHRLSTVAAWSIVDPKVDK